MNTCSYVYISTLQESLTYKTEKSKKMLKKQGHHEKASKPTAPTEDISPSVCSLSEQAKIQGLKPLSMPPEEVLYELADLFKIFGDTTRIKILYALMGQSLCVAHIAELIGATQSAVSHQLRTLKQARLVRYRRDGKNIIYSLDDDHVATVLAQGMEHICERL